MLDRFSSSRKSWQEARNRETNKKLNNLDILFMLLHLKFQVYAKLIGDRAHPGIIEGPGRAVVDGGAGGDGGNAARGSAAHIDAAGTFGVKPS